MHHSHLQAKIDQGADEVKGLEGHLPFENGLVCKDKFLSFMQDKAGWVAHLKAKRTELEAARCRVRTGSKFQLPVVFGSLRGVFNSHAANAGASTGTPASDSTDPVVRAHQLASDLTGDV
jgi:hypothetical protein